MNFHIAPGTWYFYIPKTNVKPPMQKTHILQDFPEAFPCLTIQAGLVLRKRYVPVKVTQIEHKIPIYNDVFPGVRRLPTSKYIAYDYTTSGHTDL